ncbi:MAG: hypothetical protein IPM35_24150 [Myxococcales bacterium]|nr:hypothetical protein [Myxococcales bacterium]
MQDDFDIEAFDRLCRDAPARRELLWLMAMSKQDRDTARELEGLDPGLRRRLAPLVTRHWHERRAHGLGPNGEAELYAAAYDERSEHHLAHFGGRACACGECLQRTG